MREKPAAAPVYHDMNVTPFIDVLLVLLVIFMMLNLVGRTSIRAQVPPAVPAPATESVQLVLELAADGTYTLNGQPIPAAELEMQLRMVFSDRSPSLLFVRAAPTRKYQDVVGAMDLARGAGVQVVALMPAGAAPGR